MIVKWNTTTNNLLAQHHKMFTNFQFYKIDIDIILLHYIQIVKVYQKIP